MCCVWPKFRLIEIFGFAGSRVLRGGHNSLAVIYSRVNHCFQRNTSNNNDSIRRTCRGYNDSEYPRTTHNTLPCRTTRPSRSLDNIYLEVKRRYYYEPTPNIAVQDQLPCRAILITCASRILIIVQGTTAEPHE